jgi:hypothetical protein
MTSRGNHKQYVRCLWCGKQPVSIKRGRLASHVTSGNQKCLGIGQPVEQVVAHQKLREECYDQKNTGTDRRHR